MSGLRFDELTRHPDPPEAKELELLAAEIKAKYMDDLRTGKAIPRQGYHATTRRLPRSDNLRRPPELTERIWAGCRHLADCEGELAVDDLIRWLDRDPAIAEDRNLVVSMVRYLRQSSVTFPYRVLVRKYGRYASKKCEVPSGPRRPGTAPPPTVGGPGRSGPGDLHDPDGQSGNPAA